MKRLLLFIFSLFLAIVCLAQQEYPYGNYTYKIKDETKKEISLFTFSDSGETTTLDIPTQIVHTDGETYSVTQIKGPHSAQSGYDNLCLIQPNCQIADVYIPSSIKYLDSQISRELTTLRSAIFENGDNIKLNTTGIFFYYLKTFPLEYVIIFNNSGKKITSEILVGNSSSNFLENSVTITYNDGTTEAISLFLYYNTDKNAQNVINNTKFNYLIYALQRRGTDLNNISIIDFSNVSSKFTVTFDQNPANVLSFGAKVITKKSGTFISTNIPDKVDFTAPTSDITGTINYTRSNTLNWNSVCLPFDIKESDFGGNSKIYEVTSASSHAITLSRVATSEMTIPAGTPCFIKSTDNQWDLTISDATISSSVSAQSITVGNYQVVGSFELKTIGANNYKLTADGSKFGITNKDDATVTPFRCYITPPSSSNAPAFINVNFDEEATITLVPNDAEPQKVKLYDLLGRPRKEATPGIFIKSTR
jgi:hypothetical protein